MTHDGVVRKGFARHARSAYSGILKRVEPSSQCVSQGSSTSHLWLPMEFGGNVANHVPIHQIQQNSLNVFETSAKRLRRTDFS